VVHTEDTGSQARVVVDFPPTRIPTIPVGGEAPLVFSGSSLPSDLKASGIVVLRREDFFRHRYMFQISVQPIATLPVKVALTTVETNQRVGPELSDISATGISVKVPRADEQKLFASWRMRVSLLLPDEKKAITLLGNVIYRKLVGQAVQYGIEFDSESPDYEMCQSEIMAYVLRCQAESFRQALKDNPMQPETQRKPSPTPQGAPDVD
jgi:hypothetical protein